MSKSKNISSLLTGKAAELDAERNRLLRIYRYPSERNKLSVDELNEIELIDYCNQLNFNFNGDRLMVINSLAETKNIEIYKAVSIYDKTTLVFGGILSDTRKYDLIIQRELLQKAIDLALNNSDTKSLVGLLKERRLLLGLTSVQQQLIDEAKENKESSTVIIVPKYDPKILGVDTADMNDEDILRLQQQFINKAKENDNLSFNNAEYEEFN